MQSVSCNVFSSVFHEGKFSGGREAWRLFRRLAQDRHQWKEVIASRLVATYSDNGLYTVR